MTKTCAGPNSLENACVKVVFDPAAATLTSLHNKPTDETYAVAGDGLSIVTDHGRVDLADMQVDGQEAGGRSVRVQYAHAELTASVEYRLGDHFVEKQLTVVPTRDCAVRNIVVSRSEFRVPALLAMVSYRYQQNITFFGRTRRGGFFTGLETPFDTSHAEENEVTLSYRPNLRLRAGQPFQAEPAYFGVYRREEDEPPHSGELLGGHQYQDIPQRSESEAMLAMVATILGPPRHGPTAVLSPSCCGGFGCFDREQNWRKDADASRTYRAIIDFARECGIGWMQDILPWGGEIARLNGLGPGGDFSPEPWRAELLEYARSQGITPIMWSTMNNTEPWSPEGQSFRGDRADWLVRPVTEEPDRRAPRGDKSIWDRRPNCYGSEAYLEWLTDFFVTTMKKGGYHGFSLDGDFWGTGGWYTTTAYPVRCMAEGHGHLPGEVQYACQRGLSSLLAAVRSRFPNAFLWLMRPMMDLGIWTYRNGDAVFTLDECGKVINLTGIPDQPLNLTFGDKIRYWSRIRRQRQFCPHYLDQVQLFATMDGGGFGGPWQSERLDYVMLSAISSAPNQCYFCGPIDAIPAADRAVIRRWLDWSRAHAGLLAAQKDLPDWPAKDKIDGTAHCLGDRGVIFLFNPNPKPLETAFTLDTRRLGLREGSTAFLIRQEYPKTQESSQRARYGDRINWRLPAETAAVLQIDPA